MRILKIATKSGKTRRDSGDKIFYHVSPDRINQFNPNSRMNGEGGIFLCPSYRSIIEDWTSYVAGKKKKTHPFIKQWNSLWDKQFEIVDKLKVTKNEQEIEILKNELDAAGDKLDKLRVTLDSDSYQDSQKPYQTVYIHKVSVPRNVVKQAEEFMESSYQDGYNQGNSSFWSWGEQLFFPAYLLPELDIVGVEKLNQGKQQQKYRENLEKKPKFYTPQND